MVTLARALEELPAHLASRSDVRGPVDGRPRWVLYWMRVAARAHDNPALDTAIELARALGVDVFCYHGLSERYPYASWRHHVFIIQGAADVEAEMRSRGVGYAFHLEREGHRGPHLRTLARDAGVVVTETMPVPPLRAWTGRLQQQAEVPVVSVDASCVVPMRATSRPERAFAHRRAVAARLERGLAHAWSDALVNRAPFVPELPFEPLGLAALEWASLLPACRIDPSVPPVADTLGGSAAGYARWARFLDGPIDRYAAVRNDPARDGVSRMSAYLHYGHVSPFRLARQARARGGRGAEKYLDELLLWREMSYAFCYHESRPGELSALPGWARASLDRHRGDPRPRELSWETLARARTGEPLWDLAQQSLLRHGELHNNVRMTWGKALLGWTPDPERALELLLDLNHRYALDGRDPSSYTGILWCLGLFDRAFEPGSAVRGTIRGRSLRRHTDRVDLLGYRARVGRSGGGPARVAVIGAGIAGLACARTLADQGVEVRVFDKGRRVGGRLSTRRADGWQFDHGAQYLTSRGAHFGRHLRAWAEDGVVSRWGAVSDAERGSPGADRWVGAASNRGLAEHLARDLDVRLETRVAPIASGFPLSLKTVDGDPLGDFEHVVVTAPTAQAHSLVAEWPSLTARLRTDTHDPCWALLLAFDTPLDAPSPVYRGDGPVAWAALERSKSGRPSGEAWVLHASPEWSRTHLEASEEEVIEALCRAFARWAGPLPACSYRRAHRWRYARVARPLGVPFLADPSSRVLVAGDGLIGARVEAAWVSGVAAAGRLLLDRIPTSLEPGAMPSRSGAPDGGRADARR